MQKAFDGHSASRDNRGPEQPVVCNSGRAPIHRAGHTRRQICEVRVDSDFGPLGKHVRVRVDQPRKHIASGSVNGMLCVFSLFIFCDSAVIDGDRSNFVSLIQRVDDMTVDD